ncbi:MAG: amidohydrolase [Bacteroidetes bacterium]|nr:amidohydrolase [Bacteroidota bacterium]
MQNLRVAVLQADIKWENKEQNFENYQDLLPKPKTVDLVVLPEMFQTGFVFNTSLAEDLNSSQTLEWLAKQAKRLKAVVTGSFMVSENGKVYNRLVWMRPDGSFETYDKRHLFSMSDEPNHFTPGKQKLIVELNGWKICPMICYDLRFPVWTRNTEQIDLMIFVANWPQRRSMHWAKLLQARAIENQCFIIGCNRVGNDGNDNYHDGKSAIINTLGEVLEEIEDYEGILTSTLTQEEITKTRRYMPFLKDADQFKLLG